MCFFDGHIRILGQIGNAEFEQLRKKVLSSEALWPIENEQKPNKFQCFTHTEHIIFQFPNRMDSHLESTYKPLWTDWEAVLSPVIQQATKSYSYLNGRTARIMLARLLPHGVIGRHIDQNDSANVPHKIHVPIFTNEQVEFFEDETGYFLEAGTAYEVNNKIHHSVENRSNEARVHLIFDYYDRKD